MSQHEQQVARRAMPQSDVIADVRRGPFIECVMLACAERGTESFEIDMLSADVPEIDHTTGICAKHKAELWNLADAGVFDGVKIVLKSPVPTET